MEAFTDSVWDEDWTYENALCRINELLSSSCVRVLVCEENSKDIVGCAIFETLSWHSGKQIEVREIFVKPCSRKKGIGTELIKRIETIGKQENATCYFLWTNNNTELTDFYMKLGYTTNKNVVQLYKEKS